MATVLFIRHGDHDFLNRAIAGRMPSVHLNASGKRQMEGFADAFSICLEAIYSSPLERSRESAEPLARRLGMELRTSELINEVDFGDWTGWTFQKLHELDLWKRFNEYRSGTRVPGGECMQEVQSRMMDFLEQMRLDHPNGVVAAFSHGDPIKMALMHVLAIPIDFLHRIEVSTGSINAVQITDSAVRVVCMNQVPTECLASALGTTG